MSEQKQKSQKPHYHFNLQNQYKNQTEGANSSTDPNDPPKCRVCGHHHVGKCHICGHVLNAKSNIYSASSCPSGGCPTSQELHFQLFSPSNADTFQQGWSLAKIIRRRVFVEERLSEPFPGLVCEQLWQSEVAGDDTTCQHSIGYFGDMPVTTARWRIVTQNDGQRMIKLDRICVLQRYRRRRVCAQLLAHAIETATRDAVTLNVVGVVLYCPLDLPYLASTLNAIGFQSYPQQQVEENGRQKVPFMKRLR
jgi:predicted GNAT family N-acyltransferase